jgi:hypothetical protein
MTLPIIEQPLYGEMLIETSPWATPFVWTNRTADLVAGLTYSIGGRIGQPGSSSVDVGTLNATFKNLASVPAVGALVRISFSQFAGYAWVGYVQDISQRIVFDNSVSFTTPITLTTLNCVDWVGYLSQFTLNGIGGNDSNGGAVTTSSYYQLNKRVFAINTALDSSGAATFVQLSGTTPSLPLGDTDVIGSVSEHLDLAARSVRAYWYPQQIIPTNITTGRDNLVVIRDNSSLVSSGKTFTDLPGSAGQLHYTEIDLENSSKNVANTIVVENRSRFYVPDVEVTRIGGFNQENFLIVNDQNVLGVGVDAAWSESDASSITTYGNRRSTIQTNGGLISDIPGSANLITNPSMEYDDNGYSGIANAKVRRREPLKDANPFTAYNGLWAMRARQSTAAASTRIVFSGGESDGIPVVAGTTYYFKGYAARGTVSRTDMISSMTVEWFNDDEVSISTSTSANTTLTNANTWYLVTGSAAAPANAVRATIRMSFARSGGGNISVGDRLWSDAFIFSKTGLAYFDGDTPWTSSYGYFWTGGVGASPSYVIQNYLDSIATNFLSSYSTTSIRAKRIRWNAQEDLASIPSLSVGKTISLIYKGTTTTYRIVGIDGNVDPERYMIDYYLEKV